ncbi:LOW QUALITY PROTEIN: olfactory receptor 6V1-like [Megaptera novaeangliae]
MGPGGVRSQSGKRWYTEWASSTVSNFSVVREFVLLGFSHLHEFHTLLFAFILLIYVLTVLGNLAIVTLTCLDSRLHSPRYCFLCNFSRVEVLVASTVVPRMLADLLSTPRTMSLAERFTWSFFSFSLGSTNFLILTVMAFDCYVAICRPPHYATITNGPVCVKLVVVCWVVLSSPTLQKTQLWFCGRNIIDHYFCDSAPPLKLSCSDMQHVELVDFFLSFLALRAAALLLFVASYILTVAAVLRMPSSSGHQRPFRRTSHLTVLLLGYGSAIFIYLKPGKGYSTRLNEVVAPFLNLFIFTFPNEKVREVIEDVSERILLRDPATHR